MSELDIVKEQLEIAYEDSGDELFGIWKNRKEMENVEQYVRNIRRSPYENAKFEIIPLLIRWFLFDFSRILP